MSLIENRLMSELSIGSVKSSRLKESLNGLDLIDLRAAVCDGVFINLFTDDSVTRPHCRVIPFSKRKQGEGNYFVSICQAGEFVYGLTHKISGDPPKRPK